MIAALFVSSLMAVSTVAIHMVGLVFLMEVMRKRSPKLRPHTSPLRQMIFILLVVLGLFLIHAVEIWAYAGVYMLLGAFEDFETALYFSTSTFTTLGYGDVIIDNKWRLVGAIEGFNGFLLIGWSTAFLVSVIARLRTTETDWLDHLGEDD